MLSGGTVIGQMLIVLSSPILTRIYTPEEFGGFAVFSSLASIGAVAIGMRYEFAIPVAESDDAAIGLVVLTTLIALALSLLAALALWAWQPVILDALQTPMLASVLWLLPPALFIYGAGSALNFWSIRQGTFQVNGVNRIIQFGTQAFSQVALGLMALGSVGLVVGYTAGYVTRLGHFMLSLPRTTRARFLRPSPAVIRRMMSTHWRYPAFTTSSSLLGTACEMLPAVLVAILYGPGMAGWFALSQRIVALPVRMLSDGASQVFLGEIATAERSTILRLFKKMIVLFLLIGTVGIVPVVFIAPGLFAVVFGEPWREAGIIVQLLAPLYLARFVVMPLSQTLNVLRRQDLSLLLAFGNGIAMLGSFAIGWWLALDPRWTIGLFGASGALTFILYIPLVWHILRSGTGTTSPPQRRT